MPKQASSITSLAAMELTDRDIDETTSVFEWISWDLPGVGAYIHEKSKIKKYRHP